MKVLILVFLFLASLFASDAMLQASKYEFVSQSIGKGKPYFLEVGAESCRSCQIMGQMLYKIVQKHPNYNIHFINVAKDRKTAMDLGIGMIPTQIIYDKEGEEVYRHIGMLSNEQISKLFDEHKFKE